MTETSTESRRFGELSAIIEDFDAKSAEWKGSADNAWKEFKGGSGAVTSTKKVKQRYYPLWWNTHKVREPFIYSRRPDVVCQAQGNRPISKLAASVAEKLANQIIDGFPFSRVMKASRDDLLEANMGICRVMFDAEMMLVPTKIPLTPTEVDQDGPEGPQRVTVLLDPEGEMVAPDLALQDQDGNFYVEGDEEVEEVSVVKTFLKQVDYTQFKWDYEAKDFPEWEWCAFETEMTTAQIVKQFQGEGESIVDKLKSEGDDNDDKLKQLKPRSRHKIIEMWVKDEGKRYVFAKGGSGFLAEDDDPYELEQFFPVVFPMFDNLTTECPFPALEYEQVRGILANVSDIFDRKAQAMRLARPRALFDSTIPQLSTLINKARQGEYVGVPNLSTKVQQNQAIVLYLDTQPILNMLQSLGAELQTELQAYDQVTGYSETLKGIVNPYESATGTERKSQFALSRFSNLQEDMQRFCRDNIRLLIDLALHKTPESQLWEMLEDELTDEEKAQFSDIMALLKNDYKRCIVVDIETDSTLMIDENAQKFQAQELMGIVGQFMQQIAQLAQQTPEMMDLALKTLKHLLRKVRGGRVFEEDVEQSVQGMLDRIQQQQQQAAQNPQQDPNLLMSQAEMQRVQNEGMKVQQDGQIAQMRFQVDMQKLQTEQIRTQMNLQTSQIDAYVKQSKVRLDELRLNMEMQLKAEGLSNEQRKQAFNEYVEQTRLEMEQMDQFLSAQSKQWEEVRLANTVDVPDTIVIPPQQTNVITPELLVKDGV